MLPRLSRAMLCALALLVPAAAFATPILSELTVDRKIGEAWLDNSGDETELAMLRKLAKDGSLVLGSKIEVNAETTADPVSGMPSAWFLSDVAGPGFFALKFGTGKLDVSANTFFFQNIGDLTQLVWTNDQVQFLSGGACDAKQDKCNIGRLSHYITAPGATMPVVVEPGVKEGGGEVPEPAGLALLAVGALAAAGARRRMR